MDKIMDELKKKNGYTYFLVILFLIGIILFFSSEYIFKEESGAEEREAFDENAYIQNLEERLCSIIGEIEGVSDVHCMITLEGSETWAFAEEKSRSSSGETQKTDSSVIFQQDKSGAKTPILTSVIAPNVKGVSVVCRGGSDDEIRRKIVFLISSTLDLTANRIYVTE